MQSSKIMHLNDFSIYLFNLWLQYLINLNIFTAHGDSRSQSMKNENPRNSPRAPPMLATSVSQSYSSFSVFSTTDFSGHLRRNPWNGFNREYLLYTIGMYFLFTHLNILDLNSSILTS